LFADEAILAIHRLGWLLRRAISWQKRLMLQPMRSVRVSAEHVRMGHRGYLISMTGSVKLPVSLLYEDQMIVRFWGQINVTFTRSAVVDDVYPWDGMSIGLVLLAAVSVEARRRVSEEGALQ